MKTLAVIRQTRVIPLAVQSIHRVLETEQLDALWLRHGEGDKGERYNDGTERLKLARDQFLAGPWDAMLVIDDDLILPPDSYARLRKHHVQVVMGMTVRRTPDHHWSVVISSDDGINGYVTLDQDPDLARDVWGRTIQVWGCGHNPTLIQREVIEKIPFRREPGEHGADRFFAFDCNQARIPIFCDTSLIVGHHDGNDWYVPDIESFHFRRGEDW
jgi:hypothetical protein